MLRISANQELPTRIIHLAPKHVPRHAAQLIFSHFLVVTIYVTIDLNYIILVIKKITTYTQKNY